MPSDPISEAPAFHRAILGAPGDDGPRLIYADLLEELGRHERAEFVRVQVALARSGPEGPSHDALETRSRELIASHGQEWMRELPRIEGANWARFHRGFVDYVDVDFVVDGPGAQRLLGLWDEVIAAAPIQAVWFRGLTREGARGLSGTSLLSGLLELHLTELHVDPLAGVELAVDEAAFNLEVLEFFGRAIGPPQAQRLASTPNARRWRSLTLHHAPLKDEGALALARGAHWESLRHLTLRWCEIGERGAQAIWDAPALRGLETLDLRYNPLTDRLTRQWRREGGGPALVED